MDDLGDLLCCLDLGWLNDLLYFLASKGRGSGCGWWRLHTTIGYFAGVITDQ
jgi:hypothetical protein